MNYSDNQRIASRIGSGRFNNVYDRNGSYVTAGQQDYAERLNQIEAQREEYYKELGIPPGVPTMKGAYGEPENTGIGYNTIITELGDHSVPANWAQYVVKRNPGETPGPPIIWSDPQNPEEVEAGYGYIEESADESEELFYYHSDHLGSTSYITDQDGNITQYTAYLPYGELLVDEHSSSEELPYKFNGKELDEETGLYYYGARYMQPVASIWYGVDPLFEDYPQSSPYTYCMDNPLKLIDPDGRGWIQTKYGIYYNPRVHSQNDISKRDTQKGFKYMGETFQNKNKGISYRSDGSILFRNEKDAYNHMWNNANNLYRSRKHPQGKEVGGFILSDKSVLVLPDYLNDSRTTNMDAGGYILNNRILTKGKEKFTVIGQVHTHQDKTGDPTPSTYMINSYGDLGYSKNNNSLPVFTISYDGKIYGIRGYTSNGQVIGSIANLTSQESSRENLLKGRTSLYQIIMRLPKLKK